MGWTRVLQAAKDDPNAASLNERTLQNLAALVRYGDAGLLPPSTVGQGYYPSVVLDRIDLQQQIEVFEDRFEVYDLSVVPTVILRVALEQVGQLLPLLAPLKQ